ncbi:MAG: hypothetical protein EXR71_18980 [Myxococcales bacterium]|nr:hypothetical protein [Myxococcales bacterium]
MPSPLSLRGVALLLSPRRLSLSNAIRRGEQRWLYIAFGVMAALFWGGLFALMAWLLQEFWMLSGLGPVLARKFLEILLAAVFSMLTFSNVITTMSVFYLSADLELILALPVSRPTFHYARFVDSLVQASWMMLLFGLPVFCAAGFVAHAGWPYYASIAVAVPALMVISTCIGAVFATLLVNVFPAHRTRDLLVLAALGMLAAAFVFIRTLRPEQLADAERFQDLAAYMAAVNLPAPPLFPARWAGEVMGSALLNSPIPTRELALLIAGTGAALAVARWTTHIGFAGGWSLSQEARAARFHGTRLFDTVASVLPRPWRPIAAKELRVLARDPSQWSQVFLLIGLCAVYLVSVQALPLNAIRGQAGELLRDVLTFLNLGMGGFVMAAIAGRFQFTAISREGKSWWVLRGAPVEPLVVLHAKSAFGIVPMIVVGEVVSVGGGLLLDARPAIIAGEAILVVVLAWGISGLAIAMGAIWPDFNAENTARAASSPAAVFFMVLAMGLVLGVMGLFVVGAFLAIKGWSVAAGIFGAAAIALALAAGHWPPRRAATILWARGLP